MRCSRIAIAALAGLSAAAGAQTASQTVSFDYGFDGQIVTFEKFDTLGGTRELTGLSLSYDQSITLDYRVESNGPTALAAGDWVTSIAYNSLHQFGLAGDGGGDDEDDDNNPGPPFIGPGAAFQGDITADLGASDGFNGTGPDTFFGAVDSGQFIFNADYDTTTSFGERMLGAFTGTGSLDTVLGGFTEIFGGFINDPGWVVDPNNPPEGPFSPFEDPFFGFFVTIDSLRHAGDITVTYEYRIVPTPSTAALLGLGGLLAGHRRRR